MKLPTLSSALLVVVSATTLIVYAASGGSLLAALIPILLVLGAVALVRVPLHRLALGLLFAALVLDDPRGNPAENLWDNPLAPLSVALFDNLNNVTGIDPLRFALVEVVVSAALIAAIVRTAGERRPRIPRPLAVATTAATLCIVALEAWGLAQGGDFRSSLWQIRQLFWVGPITWLFFLSLRGTADLGALVKVILGAAAVKALWAIWFVFVVCRPQGIRPAFTNTHADTVLYVTAIVLLLAGTLELRTPRVFRWAMALLPVFGLALILNNRRVAYVSLAASLSLGYLLFPPGPWKRRVTWLGLGSLVLGALYLWVGWDSDSAFFLPANKLASLFSRGDHSAVGRDIENWDLVQTYKVKPLFGWGFGHEYLEIQKADPIKEFFPLYLYIAHNSVLWLWTLGGLVGFSFLWMPHILTSWFAMRAYRTATAGVVRAAALVCACVVVIQEIQFYGDMGSQAWLGAFLFSAASAVAGKLAMDAGGWPREVRPPDPAAG